MLPQVARTGTHLFTFLGYVGQFRGWGRALRRAVAAWYTTTDVDDVAYQAVKYRSREGWTHRDALRKAHPSTDEPTRRALFDWITHGTITDHTPDRVVGWARAQTPDADVPALVRAHRLSWEMLPDTALADPATWDALLDVGVPQTALMRQLPRLTRLGMLPAMGGRTAEVAARLADAERLRNARVHPINVLVAARTYASGRSARGESTWTPTPQIVDALDAAFYNAFGAVERTGKRTMLALDVSSSMSSPPIAANMPLTPREASAAMALVTAATEPNHSIVGFTGGNARTHRYYGMSTSEEAVTPLDISPRRRLDDAIRAVSNLPFGLTDCALPMQYALQHGIDVDVFVVYTDSETWSGREHPHQALARYRSHTGIAARLVVVGMTATDITVADPTDAGMLDVAGFDTATPSLIADFSRGA